MSPRGRWARLPAAEPPTASPTAGPQLGPVVFTVAFLEGDRQVDLSNLPSRRLVGSLALGLQQYAQSHGTPRTWAGMKQIVRTVAEFVRFVTAFEQDETLRLADLKAEHLDAFEAALLAKHPAGSNQPQAVLAGAARILRLAHQIRPQDFDPELVARIGYNTRVARRRSAPVDAYPTAAFEAIRDAALHDVRAIHDRITTGERLAATGQDPMIGGWDRLENLLWLVANRRALATTADRAQRHVILTKCGGIGECNSRLLLTMHDVMSFVVALVCLTGLEPEAAKRLDADCLVNPARGFVGIRYVKLRAPGNEVKQLRVADGGSVDRPGGLLRLGVRLTQLGRDRIGSNALWVYHGRAGTKPDNGLNTMSWSTDRWMSRHGLDGLIDVDGRPVRLDLRRLRKSVKSQQYLKAAGVLADFAQGHTVQVAAAHYADIGGHAGIHDLAVEAGLRQAVGVALAPPVVFDDDGALLSAPADGPPAQAAVVPGTDSDVFLASCRDFYGSPFGTSGKPCPVALWGCLECPNAVFTTRHLPQVLSFLDFIERQRPELPSQEWNLRYGLAWQRIVHGITARFRPDQILTARSIAESGGARLLLPPVFGMP